MADRWDMWETQLMSYGTASCDAEGERIWLECPIFVHRDSPEDPEVSGDWNDYDAILADAKSAAHLARENAALRALLVRVNAVLGCGRLHDEIAAALKGEG